MSAPPDEDNLKYRWLAKARFEEHKAKLEEKAKFEQDKARKDPKPSPWSKETWQAAAAARAAGIVEPERRFPIITSSTGPLTTPQKLQEIAGLSSLPDVQWTTRASILDPDEKVEIRDSDAKKPEKVQYCDVIRDQLQRVREYSDGENVIVWFQGKKRHAWLAHSMRQKSGNRTGDGKS